MDPLLANILLSSFNRDTSQTKLESNTRTVNFSTIMLNNYQKPVSFFSNLCSAYGKPDVKA